MPKASRGTVVKRTTAKVFWTGRSQAVRLPREFRFDSTEVAIHREEVYRQIAEANLLAAQVTADSLGALAAFAPSAGATEAASEQANEAPA